MILGVAVVAVFVAHGTDSTPRGYGCQGVSTIERFKADLDAYITHWNTTRRQVKLKGLTPAEYRDQ
ncbi:MAG: IS3 family transposase, partial [Actinomyces sp.]|nr:IS3 family transposase [Actinomyces sp.]